MSARPQPSSLPRNISRACRRVTEATPALPVNSRQSGAPTCKSGRGRDQSDAHIPGDVGADVVGKQGAVGDGDGQLAAPDMAHADLVSRKPDIRRYLSPKLHLADADRAALARRARPAKPVADDLPHG